MASAGNTDLADKWVSVVKETTEVHKTTDDDGHKKINTFEVLDSLGKGAFGKVKLCKDIDTDETFAIKIMDKTVLKKKRQGMSNMLESVMKEIAIMKKLNHVNCVRIFEVINDPNHSKLYLRLEYVDGGQCMPSENGTAPLPVEKAQAYWGDLICGLEYLHFNRVLHRDIKPENLLVNKAGVLKLADFGVSDHIKEDGDDTISKSAGTPAFMAPECCEPGSFSGKQADLWAAAVSLYFMLHGKCPIIESNVIRLFERIVKDPIEFDAALPPDVLDLLTRALDKDRAKRLSLQEIKEHPWFRSRAEAALPAQAVSVSEDDVRSAMTLSDRVVLMVKIQDRFHKLLSGARARIKARKAAEGAQAEQSLDAEVAALSVSCDDSPAKPPPADAAGSEARAATASRLAGLTQYLSDEDSGPAPGRVMSTEGSEEGNPNECAQQ